MGLFTMLARAFGVAPPIEPREAAQFRVSPAAKKRIGALAPGQVLHVATTPVPGGRVAVAREVAAASIGTPVDAELGVAVSPDDRHALRGLVLDHDGAQFRVTLEVRVEGRETPNPDSRLYETERFLAYGRPRFFSKTSDPPPLARRLLKIEGIAAVLVRDNTVTVQREPGVGWAVLDRAVDAAIREHLLMCGEPIPDAGDAAPKEGLAGRVAEIVAARIAPAIHQDGGDIEVVDVEGGVVRVHLIGACETCPASEATLRLGVERTLRAAFPGEIERVESI